MPGGMKAPKLWPAEPLKWSRMVSSGSPAGPWRRVTSRAEHGAHHPVHVADGQRRPVPARLAPWPAGRARAGWSRRATRRGRGPAGSGRCGRSAWARVGLEEDAAEVEVARLPVVDGAPHLDALRRGRPSRRGCGSRAAPCISRTSSAMKRMKLTTCAGSPVKRLRSSGSWVATPTGQVLRWQARIMMQPSTTSGAVAKPNSSAPSSAAMTTSRPVLSWPSHSTAMRERRLFMHQHLVRLGEAQLPGDACVLDGGERRGAGAAVVAADEHHVGVRLGHPGGDGAHPHLGHQLHRDAGAVVGVLEVVDELRPGPRWSRCRGAAAAR